MPKRYPIVDKGIASQLGLRKATVGNYAVFYRVDDESRKVLVDRVMYGRRSLGCHAG